MKTLYLTTTLVLLIITVGTIKESYSYGSNVGYLMPSPQSHGSVPLAVTTNLENYTSTDEIVITSHVSNPDSNVPLMIKILNPYGLPVSSHTFVSSTNESYTLQVLPIGPLFNTSGNYTVTAQYESDKASTYFYLTTIHNGIIAFYSPPLKQFKSGIAPKDVKCPANFLLTFKAEDGSPACVKPDTAQKLIERGWITVGNSQTYPISEIKIVGLQQTYKDGQPIDVAINYTGYITGGIEPEVTILDNNGTQVWTSCCFAHTETPGRYYGTAIFNVQGPKIVNGIVESGYPVINKTGTYTMVASLDNKKTEAKFTVVSNDANNEIAFHDYPNAPQYSIVDTTVGISVETDSVATKMVGFDVTSPTYLPQGYQVRLIKVAKDIPWVTIFVSKSPMTNKTTNEEFFYNDTGILITYSKLSDRALRDHQWRWSMATTIKKVTIDGFDAGIEGIRKGQHDGYSYDQWADLVLFKDKILVGVSGFFSDDDLVKITKSMLENQK